MGTLNALRPIYTVFIGIFVIALSLMGIVTSGDGSKIPWFVGVALGLLTCSAGFSSMRAPQAETTVIVASTREKVISFFLPLLSLIAVLGIALFTWFAF